MTERVARRYWLETGEFGITGHKTISPEVDFVPETYATELILGTVNNFDLYHFHAGRALEELLFRAEFLRR